ncbi:MAG TPA: glycosyltransferase family 1 protein [Bacteroidia bacterium]|jgi:glycosyltransferase involved in cell wall biosynthesis|nr:glycosyltransferase family 1 protein [Bacteroidia bacterium]
MIYINGRFLTQNISGAQRFGYEITKELLKNDKLKNICILVPPSKIDPAYDTTGFPLKVIGKNKGQAWEQIDLPIFLYKNGRELLVNLLNSAPIAYKHQVVTILDMTTFINPKWFKKYFVLYYKFIVPIIARKSIKIITISECSKKDIIHYTHVPEDKVAVVYCSVASQFNRGASDKDMVDRDKIIEDKLKISKNNYLLTVSSLDPRKNFVSLVKAYNEIETDVPPLVIVGSEGKVFASDELKEIISRSKNILLTGYVSDDELVTLYRSASFFIYPSLYEGFGMPPLEAMACGCPTIVSNTSSLPEVCGDASVYIDPYSINSIKQGIIKLTNDANLRSQLVSLGEKQVEKFSWQRSGAKLSEIINELI